MYGYIYKTTNLINNKIYIGQHRVEDDKFDNKYFGSGKLILEAINKYGVDNFLCEVLEWCSTEQELNEREIHYIDKFNSKVTFGNYNMSSGGYVPRLSGELNGNYNVHRPHTEEEKKHLSEVAKNHKPTFTRKHTTEERAKMGIKAREYNLTKKDYTQVSKANTGKKFMSKNGIQKWINKEDIQQYLDDGWIFGACNKRNRIYSDPWNKGKHGVQKNCKSVAGYIRVTNGVVNTTIRSEYLQEYIDKGYRKGITRKKRS